MTKRSINKGDLLLSEPFLGDDNFHRTVIFICQQNEHGYLGFVLNKKITNADLDDVVDEAGGRGFPLYLGGPVENSVLQFIHTLGNKIDNSLEVLPGIYWGGDFEQVKTMIRNHEIQEGEIKFFLGYSGWGKEQMENELAEKSWMITDASKKDVFEGNEKELWKEVLIDMGGKYKIIANYPEDPSLN
ncbi:MAG: YqgE/AlgH family protein [Cyclobacteriaceae bacterium]